MGTDRARAGTVRGQTAVIIIPWRDKGDPHRRANLDFVLNHLDAINVAPVHVVSDGRDGPFNRSAAYNNGRRQHPAETYIYHEADMICPPEQLETAIDLASARPGLVVPFNTYRGLTCHDTQLVHEGHPPQAFQPELLMPNGASVGAVNVVSELTMRLVGRWDDRFSGWGYDDNAMFEAFHKAAGSCRWVEGSAYHLWHTPGVQAAGVEADATNDNYLRFLLYRDATTAEQIRALTSAA